MVGHQVGRSERDHSRTSEDQVFEQPGCATVAVSEGVDPCDVQVCEQGAHDGECEGIPLFVDVSGLGLKVLAVEPLGQPLEQVPAVPCVRAEVGADDN